MPKVSQENYQIRKEIECVFFCLFVSKQSAAFYYKFIMFFCLFV